MSGSWRGAQRESESEQSQESVKRCVVSEKVRHRHGSGEKGYAPRKLMPRPDNVQPVYLSQWRCLTASTRVEIMG